jgi:plastocyanin
MQATEVTGSKSRIAVLVGLAMSVVLLFPASAPADTFRVRAQESPDKCGGSSSGCWKASYRHISKGDRIVWVNPAANMQDHDVHAIGSNWGKSTMLRPGERTSKVFKRTGLYKYRCRIHSQRVDGRWEGMIGAIHVGG